MDNGLAPELQDMEVFQAEECTVLSKAARQLGWNLQAASAKVPDQEHPEKYLNHNHDLLLSVVEHNLWRKQTKQFKHHPEKHGDKLKVIPHLVQSK